jgi:nitrogenase subunit NifH
MPPASFTSEETRKAFYEKNNKMLMERYHNDPEFRKANLDRRKVLYYKNKANNTGPFSPENIAIRIAKDKERYLKKKAEKAEVLASSK